MADARPVAVYLEVGKRRVFACAYDWPGWCRAGKTADEALASLAEVAPRFAVVAEEAGLDLPPAEFEVVERVPGNGTTDFGAPDVRPSRDWEPMTGEEGARLATLVEASWKVFRGMARKAPAVLPKGPRGGGRDRDQIVIHVVGAELPYSRKMGISVPKEALDQSEGRVALRQPISEQLRKRWSREETPEKGWPPRYAARRIAWHVLDHAWELEDKSAARQR